MSSNFQVGIHKASSTSYMVKRLGGANNVLSCKKNDLMVGGVWTYYTITLKDPSLITTFSKNHMRIKPL